MGRPSDWEVLDLPGDPVPGDPPMVESVARRWSQASTFRTSTYDEVLLRNKTTMYRSIAEGGTPRGMFWAREAPTGPLETQLNMALKPEWNITNRFDLGAVHEALPQATHYVTADFPAGTRIFQGPTAPQFSDGIFGVINGKPTVSIPGGVLGGGEQVVPDPAWVNRWNAAVKGGNGVDPYGLTGPVPVR